jgi:tRNA pseudouridine32 synthase/23S rRNA pseudouridine746 synthase
MVEDAQFFRMREVTAGESAVAAAENSETWINCIERIAASNFSAPSNPNSKMIFARYLLKPLTGQRHQLRVHMNALGLPILGDQFYPFVKRSATEDEDFTEPLQLLAKTISFLDPLNEAKREFTSQLQLNH